jgi:SAM-dependent methyltransferase
VSDRDSSAAAGQVATSWDREYRSGRYEAERPVGLVDEILGCSEATDLPRGRGLYVGCGNGRNYLPLVAGGLDLVGLDVSAAALKQLAERAPERAADLLLGDLSALPPEVSFAIVIGIQVFQHGCRADAHENIRAAMKLVLPGGLLCIRVNAVGTDIRYRHRLIEQDADGGFTVEYLEGPKAGLAIHFFAGAELSRLVDPFEPVLELRSAATQRTSPRVGFWLQWEGIWRRPGAVDLASRTD